jgi:hypothetical protein
MAYSLQLAAWFDQTTIQSLVLQTNVFGCVA